MTNFRAVKIGGIAAGVLYRSEHPAAYGIEEEAVVELAKAARINCIINLTDTEASLRRMAEGSPWYAELLDRGKVRALGMNFDFGSSAFNRKLREAFVFLLSHDGPYLVHCYAGVDRTGFFCAVLEALMGAAPEEIAADYARSFYNGADSAVYTGEISGAGSSILRQLADVFGVEVFDGENIVRLAECYLGADLGLTTAQVEGLKLRLAGAV